MYKESFEEYLRDDISQAAAVEVYQFNSWKDSKILSAQVHPSSYSWDDIKDQEIEVSYVSYDLMEEDEYNSDMVADGMEKVSFAEKYGDKDAKVLVVVLDSKYNPIPPDFDIIAEAEGLQVIETTSEANGYPANIKKALIGFENFEHAEKVADKYGLSIASFQRKDGWQLYYRDSYTVYGPIEPSAEDYGDDYEILRKKDLEDFYENQVKGVIGEFDDFEVAQGFLDACKNIYDELSEAEEDEMVLTYKGEYIDTIPCKCMSFHIDNMETVIGVMYDRYTD